MLFELPSDAKILVVALRRLGDVLLTTPLIGSLREAWPQSKIDVLVFSDTAGILEGNPDLNAIITMPPRPTVAQSLKVAKKLWRKYDLSISTQCGDRPTFCAIVAGRRRIGPVEANFNGRLKGALLDYSIPYVPGLHRVEEILRLADLLGIQRKPSIVCPRPTTTEAPLSGDYAVVHAAPMFRYKQWTKRGWREVAAWLSARGLSVIATGGPSQAERDYLDDIWADCRVVRVDAQLDWQQLVAVLSKARIYIGPDTSVTHLAAATGCPTVAIYGPTDPRLWGPWPMDSLTKAWVASAPMQNRGNVWIVQNPLPCMPCQLEGCERRLESYSACLAELRPAQVIAAAEMALR